ncbi:hypothetical protein NUW58_g3688 [Xylaria curta]|uniref:Uncharacterized protein n=1 Tax=Xylaria curta TaxID=42375 RepID=A0ACC1P9T8_9PEZI|nr:hypothetical protein NUW58_g3688 [Xylaria curta]
MEPLSEHLQGIKQEAEDLQSRHPSVDRFPPSLTPSDGAKVATVTTQAISYYFTTKVFIKRQPHEDELGLDIFGNPAINPYIPDRLRNEAAALQFVAEHTTIPVPKFLNLWEENGLVYLKTAIVENGVELRHINESLLPTAIKKVTAQLESDILPQLRRLRRGFMGSPNPELPVIPPRRFWDWKEKRVWPSMPKDTDEYVLCHTDLDRQNILVDPHTFQIVSIIDWETAGFFPLELELPYWKANTPSERHEMSTAAKSREATYFGVPCAA